MMNTLKVSLLLFVSSVLPINYVDNIYGQIDDNSVAIIYEPNYSGLSPNGTSASSNANTSAASTRRYTPGGCWKYYPGGTIYGNCVDRSVKAEPVDAEVQLNAGDVSRLLLGSCPAQRQPAGKQALVSEDLIVYTKCGTQVLTTSVKGIAVTVEATPISYEWDWGDGATLQTTDSGAPFPNQSLTHRYAATKSNTVVGLKTHWSAVFTPAGGTQQPVAGEVVTDSATTPFDLVHLTSFLTDDALEREGK